MDIPLRVRIAQLAPIAERVPPKKYGGIERVVYALCEELVKGGHDVTLFGSGDSQTSAKLISVYPKSLREAKISNVYGPNSLTSLHIGYAYERASQFDIIHDHLGYMSLPSANLSKVPVVMTLHGSLGMEERRIFENLKNPYLVTISNSQARFVENLNYIGTVYNGLNMENFPFSNKDEGYLLFVGRIAYEKGVHLAIEVARYLDLPLIIAAKLNSVNDDPSSYDLRYFQQFIEPKLSDQIRWVGEVDEAERNKLMSKAKALLMPVSWPEPFGLVIIEALSCGCPVVGFNKGSIPEIIKSEVGFVVEDVSGMISAVSNIDKIDRGKCREYSLKNFNAKKMADKYEEIYTELVS